MPPVVRDEHDADRSTTRELVRRAFGQDDEARLVDALRDEGYARVSLVAEEGERIVGHVLFSTLPIKTPRGTVEALALAPLAVSPSDQNRGIGSLLVREGLRICRERGHRIVVVLGSPKFYPRFGFSAELARPLKAPFPGEAFMALELVPGVLARIEGEVLYPPPFETL